MDLSNIIPDNFDLEIKRWIIEDIPSFDIGGFVVGSAKKKAKLFIKSSGILAGVPFFTKVFHVLNCEVEWLISEGELIEPNKAIEVAIVTGNINKILIGERLALNLISRASGVAYKAYNVVNIAKQNGFLGKISGTRKTTPGLRLIEKYGLIIGGADTHRMDLSSMVMLKDNHIQSMGSISKAVKKARKIASVWTKIEVECNSYSQAIEAIESGADIIMLDNFSPDELDKTALKIKEKHPKSILEASGGINEENITRFFSSHIDIISMGSLTNNYTPVDFSMKI